MFAHFIEKFELANWPVIALSYLILSWLFWWMIFSWQGITVDVGFLGKVEGIDIEVFQAMLLSFSVVLFFAIWLRANFSSLLILVTLFVISNHCLSSPAIWGELKKSHYFIPSRLQHNFFASKNIWRQNQGTNSKIIHFGRFRSYTQGRLLLMEGNNTFFSHDNFKNFSGVNNISIISGNELDLAREVLGGLLKSGKTNISLNFPKAVFEFNLVVHSDAIVGADLGPLILIRRLDDFHLYAVNRFNLQE